MAIEPDDDALAAALLARQRRALAKAITLVESSRPDHRLRAQSLLDKLLPHTGKAYRIGISGVPGVGKSTFIEAFGMHLLAQGLRVAVLAVDPSSPLTGGSILGDNPHGTPVAAGKRLHPPIAHARRIGRRRPPKPRSDADVRSRRLRRHHRRNRRRRPKRNRRRRHVRRLRAAATAQRWR
jgi:Mrp family chromosome partitioning ATPase